MALNKEDLIFMRYEFESQIERITVRIEFARNQKSVDQLERHLRKFKKALMEVNLKIENLEKLGF